jgi:hypothetical protein
MRMIDSHRRRTAATAAFRSTDASRGAGASAASPSPGSLKSNRDAVI